MNYKIPTVLLLISAILYYIFSPTPPLSDDELSSHLNDKVVLVCGASSGIGEELAYQLGGHGARLALVARSQNKLENVREELIRRGTPAENVLIISFDFSNVSGSKEVVEETLRKFGSLDYLVSNHAMLLWGPILALPELQDPDYIEKIFRINMFSHIQLAVHALPHLEKQKGHMFFTSSILGEIPMYSASLYSSTKHAMNGFFYSLQQELLARESPVSLTVGAFGLILTKQVKETFGDGPNPFYDWANGGLEGCARGMVEAYVTRPQTMTFSRLTGLTYRPLWYFAPNFLHEEMIRKIKAYVESYRK